MRCSLLSVKQLNYHDDTDQGWFLVVRRHFTVLYKNPKRRDRLTTQTIKPIRSSQQSLQLKRGLLSVFFNFSKHSPFQSPFWLCWTVLFDSEFCIYEWEAIRKFNITNKCSTMCVCRIVLQNIYVNIQKIELKWWYFQCIQLTLWWNLSFSWWMKPSTQNQKNQQSICYKTKLRKIRCKCFDNVLGSDSLKNIYTYNNKSRCILEWTHLPMYRLMMETEHIQCEV